MRYVNMSRWVSDCFAFRRKGKRRETVLLRKARTTATLNRTLAAVTEEYEDNGYNDTLNKYALSKGRYYYSEIDTISNTLKLITTYAVFPHKSLQLHTFKRVLKNQV